MPMLTPTSRRRPPSDLERLLHGAHDAPRDRPGALDVGGRGQQDRELVAAEPGDRVALADAFLQALGELHQQQVADVVAERVVDLLEAVEVEQQQRQRLAGARRGAQRLGQAVLEQQAVGQPGQRVVHRLMAQPALLRLGER